AVWHSRRPAGGRGAAGGGEVARRGPGRAALGSVAVAQHAGLRRGEGTHPGRVRGALAPGRLLSRRGSGDDQPARRRARAAVTRLTWAARGRPSFDAPASV